MREAKKRMPDGNRGHGIRKEACKEWTPMRIEGRENTKST